MREQTAGGPICTVPSHHKASVDAVLSGTVSRTVPERLRPLLMNLLNPLLGRESFESAEFSR